MIDFLNLGLARVEEPPQWHIRGQKVPSEWKNLPIFENFNNFQLFQRKIARFFENFVDFDENFAPSHEKWRNFTNFVDFRGPAGTPKKCHFSSFFGARTRPGPGPRKNPEKKHFRFPKVVDFSVAGLGLKFTDTGKPRVLRFSGFFGVFLGSEIDPKTADFSSFSGSGQDPRKMANFAIFRDFRKMALFRVIFRVFFRSGCVFLAKNSYFSKVGKIRPRFLAIFDKIRDFSWFFTK